MNNNYIIISLPRASPINYGGNFFPKTPFYERGQGCKLFWANLLGGASALGE